MTCPFYLLEIEGLFTQGSRPGRTFGESVGGILEMDSSDWSSGIRHHVFVTRSDTEFKSGDKPQLDIDARSGDHTPQLSIGCAHVILFCAVRRPLSSCDCWQLDCLGR